MTKQEPVTVCAAPRNCTRIEVSLAREDRQQKAGPCWKAEKRGQGIFGSMQKSLLQDYQEGAKMQGPHALAQDVLHMRRCAGHLQCRHRMCRQCCHIVQKENTPLQSRVFVRTCCRLFQSGKKGERLCTSTFSCRKKAAYCARTDRDRNSLCMEGTVPCLTAGRQTGRKKRSRDSLVCVRSPCAEHVRPGQGPEETCPNFPRTSLTI